MTTSKPASFSLRQKLYADSIAGCWRGLGRRTDGHDKPHPLPAKLTRRSVTTKGSFFLQKRPPIVTAFKLSPIMMNGEGGKVRVGWNERPQLIGEKPGDSCELKFKGSAVAIMVIAGRAAGIIEHSVDGSDWVKQDLFVTNTASDCI